jgi:hypothetical protein
VLEITDKDINAGDAINCLSGERGKTLFIDKKSGSKNG